MAPSECPICGRQMCDHTCAERGQTYAEMMGDPPGTHPHITGGRACGCLCDCCTAPPPKLPKEIEYAVYRRFFRCSSDIVDPTRIVFARKSNLSRSEVWDRARASGRAILSDGRNGWRKCHTNNFWAYYAVEVSDA